MIRLVQLRVKALVSYSVQGPEFSDLIQISKNIKHEWESVIDSKDMDQTPGPRQIKVGFKQLPRSTEVKVSNKYSCLFLSCRLFEDWRLLESSLMKCFTQKKIKIVGQSWNENRNIITMAIRASYSLFHEESGSRRRSIWFPCRFCWNLVFSWQRQYMHIYVLPRPIKLREIIYPVLVVARTACSNHQ